MSKNQSVQMFDRRHKQLALSLQEVVETHLAPRILPGEAEAMSDTWDKTFKRCLSPDRFTSGTFNEWLQERKRRRTLSL